MVDEESLGSLLLFFSATPCLRFHLTSFGREVRTSSGRFASKATELSLHSYAGVPSGASVFDKVLSDQTVPSLPLLAPAGAFPWQQLAPSGGS